MRLDDVTAAKTFGAITGQSPVSLDSLPKLGHSREGRAIGGIRLGSGPIQISLIAGCHADEPTGPRFLCRLLPYLQRLPDSHPLRHKCTWWIVPEMNPDGAQRNEMWTAGRTTGFDFADYLAKARRAPQREDIEFGFPTGRNDGEARVETRCVFAWWQTAGGPFDLHASLHSLPIGSGPWFLLDPAWAERSAGLQERCRRAAAASGYPLHDENRHGEKGFQYIAPGFSTCPTSNAMRDWFRQAGAPQTAAAFRPSSMEAIRQLGGDPLCVVSEMPLFLVPAPFDPDWRQRWRLWLEQVKTGEVAAAEVAARAHAQGLRPMLIRDQMYLQWELILAALKAT